MGILLNILTYLVIFGFSSIDSKQFYYTLEDDQSIFQQVSDCHIEFPDLDGETDTNNSHSQSCKCNSKLQAYYRSQGKCCYYTQFTCCYISYEADKSPPFQA